ncbi:MAG TPA: hypothetical protein VMM18_06740 [Gemmatimonadaceae bacterium]|nr:hypothetical protein [Gemmatimonadaceae bacterium]
MRLIRALVYTVVAAGCGGGGSTPNQPVEHVQLNGAGNLTISVGDSRGLSVTLRDAQNSVLTGRQVTWTITPNPAGAASLAPTSGSQTTLSASAVGTSLVRATSEGKSAEVTFTIEEEAPAPSAVQVNLSGTSFVPSSVTLLQGGTVTWNNGSAEVHDVTFGTNAPAGGNIDPLGPGAEAFRTFNVVAEIDYVCTRHPGMSGSISVVAP